jgi:hypothetical protein
MPAIEIIASNAYADLQPADRALGFAFAGRTNASVLT